mgnify:CR=1 FL=1
MIRGIKSFISIITTVLLLISTMLGFYGTDGTKNEYKTYKNVILMIGDGMGFNTVEAAKSRYGIDELPMETFPVHSQSKTRSASNKITDSAAGATALSCGVRTYNNAVGVYAFAPFAKKFNTPKSLTELAKENGKEYLYEILKEVDPEYAQIVHFNNVKRVIRALEYHKETGHKLSEHNKEQRQKDSPYNFAYFVLYHDREVLYDRINRRVDLMMEDGLLEEVKGLIEEGYTKDLVSMQGLGYKEFFDYFDGEMSLEETVDKVKRDTRRFAKRQLTWFRREKEVVWLNKKEYEQEKNLLDSVLNIIKEKGIWDGTKR